MATYHRATKYLVLVTAATCVACTGDAVQMAQPTAPDDQAAATKSVYIAKAVSSGTDLPSCNAEKQGQVYLALETHELYLCESSSWQVVDLTGPAGQVGSPGMPGVPGVEGPGGPMGPAGPAGQAGVGGAGEFAADYDFISVRTNEDKSQTQSMYAGGPSGRLIRSCSLQTSTKTFDFQGQFLGTLTTSTFGGGAGCSSLTTQALNCAPGARAVGASCLPGPPPMAGLANAPQVPSGCSFTQDASSCQELTFQPAGLELCGTYREPVTIETGLHLVTCDVAFKNKVIVEAGADIRFDRNWSFSAKGGFHAVGTSVNPISFKNSSNNPVHASGNLQINYPDLPALSDQFVALNPNLSPVWLKFVTFGEYNAPNTNGSYSQSQLQFGHAVLDSVSFLGANLVVTCDESIVENSTFPSGGPAGAGNVTDPVLSLALNGSVLRNASGYASVSVNDNSIAWGNNGNMTLFANASHALVASNNVGRIFCGYAPPSLFVVANATDQMACGGGNHVVNNVTRINTPPATKFLYNLGGDTVSAIAGQSFSLPRCLVTGAPDTDSSTYSALIDWTATYDFDGTTHTYTPTWRTGLRPTLLQIDDVERYQLCPTMLDLSPSFVGSDQCLTVKVDRFAG